MRALMLEIPDGMLEERSRLGHDRHDEVWDGVLHMVPSPTFSHQHLESALIVALTTIAARRGLVVVPETAVFDPAAGRKNYRVPDLTVVHPDHTSERGIEGRAELVIEILSPDDESRDKLPFYARIGVREVWLIAPATRTVEVFTLVNRAYRSVSAEHGVLRAPALGLELETIAGPRLRIRDDEQVADV